MFHQPTPKARIIGNYEAKLKPNGVAYYGALGHMPPRLSTISVIVYFGVNLTLTIHVLCSLQDQLVQMSTTRSSVDQYCNY